VSFDNITVSCQGDAGTNLDENNKRRALRGFGANSHSDILKAVSLRGTPLEGESCADPYNEICCEGYNLIGLFADNLKLSFQQTDWPPVITHSVDEIGAMLPDLPLFLWVSNEGTFLRLQYDPIQGGYDKDPLHVRKVPISKIYDEPWFPNKAASPEPSAASD
jgi:hypothetical protein